jgi:hypothetical protein
MSENKLIGSLVLRTIDIEPSRNTPIINTTELFENEYGIYAANGGVATWKNVNLRTCLGELYYKYNRFNLKLTSVQFRQSGSSLNTHSVIYMSGLPFSSGSGYNTRLGPTNQVAIGCINPTGGGITTSILSGLVSFDKPLQNTFDITIEFKNSTTITINNYSEKATTLTGHWSIMCDIYGIDK